MNFIGKPLWQTALAWLLLALGPWATPLFAASGDTTPPAAVTNLSVIGVTTNSISLGWTAPGDDGNTGTANQYDVRYSTSLIGETNWASATQANGEPTPATAGTMQTFTVTGLLSGVTYYLALKTSDETNNLSPISNVPAGFTLPSTPSSILITSNAVWKYLDNGSDQSNAWSSLGFNDSAWASGPAILGYLGGHESTVVSYGTNASAKYITTYFRRHFTVSDPSFVIALRVSLLRDDGGVVYLNGQEVFRDNMPTGAVTYLTPAATSVSGTDKTSFHDSPPIGPGGLVSGDNVVAVEIHQRSASSSSMDFALQLTSTNRPPPPSAPTATALSAAPNPAFTGDAVTFTATVTNAQNGASVTLGTVTFAEGGTTMAGPSALDANGQARFTTNGLSAGSHTLTATYSGSAGGFTASQGTVTVNVCSPLTQTPLANHTACQGTVATFGVTSTGSSPLSLVWKKGTAVLTNGVSMGGRVSITGSNGVGTLAIALVQTTDADTYSVQVTDACGHAASSSAALTVNPVPMSPSISFSPSSPCPNSMDNQASGPADAASYSWIITNGTITSATNAQTVNYIAGGAGNVALTLRISNPSGCVAASSTNVPILIDTVPPAIMCPASSVTNTAPGRCDQVVGFAATAADNCGAVDVSCSPTNGSAFGKGTTTVTCTAIDAAGNSSICSFTVTVIDTENPVITCPANIVTNTTPGRCDQVVGFTATATDNCAGVGVSCSPTNGAVFLKGTATVTCTAIDAAGNNSMCSFTVTVIDTENPAITCPANIVTNTAPGRCDQVVGFVATATDNCADVEVSCTPTNGSTFVKGTATVACTAIDAVGNISMCSFTVTVIDSENPVITCPANLVTNTAPGRCDQVVGFIATATDNCAGVDVSCTPASGSTFVKGTTTVTCTATDAAGNSSMCSFTVTVNDAQNPAIACPANIVTNNAPGRCDQVVGFAAVATDNCAGATVSCSPANGSTFLKGTTGVICTATDAAGHTSACSFTVTVNDTQAPSINCPANILTNTTPGRCDQVVGFVATATDNCAGVTVSCSPTNGSTFGKGATTVNCTATDAVGNSSACSFTVTVNDNENPAITCPANIVTNTAPGRCDQVVGFAATATDNCAGTTVSCIPTNGSSFLKGTTTVTCTAIDAAGNSSMCSFTVTVNDLQNPAITCPANIITNTAPGRCDRVVSFAATAADNCAGATVSCSPTNGSTFLKGTTGVICTATDAAGHTATCSFTVTVNDTQAPSITCPANLLTNTTPARCDQVVGFVATATDNCAGVTVNCSPTNGSTFGKGATLVNCTAIDAAGNSSTCSFTVTVNDNETPAITCPANIVTNTAAGRCDQVVGFAATATDNCAGTTVSCIPTNGSSFLKGTTTVTCTATDAAGNSSMCSFTVTVIDAQNPAITCPANIVTNTAPGRCDQVVGFAATATDNCAGATISCSPTNGATFLKGTTTVNCTATDAAGHTAACSFTVTVNDTQAPSITCPANILTNTTPGRCDQVVGFTATASDNCAGVTVSCSPTNGSAFGKGATTVNCTATDAVGNSSTCSFTVTVNDLQGPSISCPANIVTNTAPGRCDRVVGFTATTADNCPGATVNCSPANGAAFAKGTTTVTCTVTDAAGNSATCSFTVTVNDAEPPAVTCPPNIVTNTIPGRCDQIVGFAAAAADNCGGLSASCSPGAGSIFLKGTTTVTCTATDAVGNGSACSFTVTVNDAEHPVITCPPNIVTNTAPGRCDQVVSFAATASDNCAGVNVNCTPASGSAFTKGSTAVTCTATDAAGNSSTCGFIVTVNDAQNPAITCPADIVTNTTPGRCDRIVSFAATPIDNCAGVTLNCAPTSGSTFLRGTTTVTCTAADAAGNTAMCNFTVTVNDAESPVITCPADIVTNTAPGQCSQVVNFTVAAIDNCSAATISCSPTNGSTFESGTTRVTCAATDADGNISMCSFAITCNTHTISPATLPSGLAGVAFTNTLTVAEGFPPYTFSLISGSLPPGTTLSTDGVLSGTPTMDGTYPISVKATDVHGCAGVAVYTWRIYAANTRLAAPAQLNLRIPPVATGGSGDLSQDLTRSSIFVSDMNTQLIKSVSVGVLLHHPRDGDLVIKLTPPGGTAIMLANRCGANGSNYIYTTFRNYEPAGIAGGAAPFTGNFRPEEPLAFDTPNGEWKLEIEDKTQGSSGILLDWSLSFLAPAFPETNVWLWSAGLNSSAVSMAVDSGLAQSLHQTYVQQGNRLSAFRNTDGGGVWENQTISPARLAMLDGEFTEALIAASASGLVFGLRPADGSQAWIANTRRGNCPSDSLSAVPAVQLRRFSDATFQAARSGDLIFVVTDYKCGTTTANRVWALDGGTGGPVWIYNVGLALDRGTGVAVDYSRNMVFCTFDKTTIGAETTVLALGSVSGSFRWQRDVGAVQSRPLLVNGALYVAAANGAIYKLNPDTGGPIWISSAFAGGVTLTNDLAFDPARNRLLVTRSDGGLFALNDLGSSTTLAWSNNLNGALAASTSVLAPDFDKVYVGSRTGRVFQVDAASGQVEAFATLGTNGPVFALMGDSDDGGLAVSRLLALGPNGLVRASIPWGLVPVDKGALISSPGTQLRLTAAVQPGSATLVGQPVAYTLTAENLGDTTASYVTLWDTLPAGLGFRSATVSQGTFGISGSKVTADFGPLLPSTTATLSLVVTSSIPGSYQHVAALGGYYRDTFLSDNSAIISHLVAQMPTLASPAWTSGNRFQLTLTGQTGAAYVIQASTNLSPGSWVSIYTNAAPFPFEDPNAPLYRQRFYRALPAP